MFGKKYFQHFSQYLVSNSLLEKHSIMRTKLFCFGTKERIVTQRGSDNSGKGCKATSKALGVPI